jgi:mRNA interferase MazF
MPYHRGEVIAIPYTYADLSGGKTRPAVIVSTAAYNTARPDVVAAAISTQLPKAGLYDHVLSDWAAAGLRYPSFIRARLLTVEKTLIRRSLGTLTVADLASFDEKLLEFMVSDEALALYLNARVNVTALPPRVVQSLAEQVIAAAVMLATDPAIDLDRLGALLPSQATP